MIEEPYKSTRKDPDLYIKKLKKQIEDLLELVAYDQGQADEERGAFEFDFSEGRLETIGLIGPNDYDLLLIGTKVKFTAKVVEVFRHKTGGKVAFELKNCYRLK